MKIYFINKILIKYVTIQDPPEKNQQMTGFFIKNYFHIIFDNPF
jgi:hypothetical protein